MNTQISARLAALVIALMMNSLIIGGVACLFDGRARPNAIAISQDHAPAAELG